MANMTVVKCYGVSYFSFHFLPSLLVPFPFFLFPLLRDPTYTYIKHLCRPVFAYSNIDKTTWVTNFHYFVKDALIAKLMCLSTESSYWDYIGANLFQENSQSQLDYIS